MLAYFFLCCSVFVCIFAQTMVTTNFTISFRRTDVSCAENLKSRFPTYAQRFGEELLLRQCRRSRMWRSDASAGQRQSRLTPKQMQYFRSVTDCKTVHCLCEKFPVCNKTMENLQKLFGHQTDVRTMLVNGTLPHFVERAKFRTNDAFLQSLLKNRARRQADDATRIQNIVRQFGKCTRQEIRTLTSDELLRLFRVLNTLKNDHVDGMSKYDILIVDHRPENAPGAHFGASFLPYHRELLKNLEMAMRFVDPAVCLPYWDSTLDSHLPDERHSILWTEDFLGNGDGSVRTGPFANWRTLADPQSDILSNAGRIVRSVGPDNGGSVFRESDVDDIMARNAFRDLVYCIDPFFEMVHGALHNFVGGHMLDIRVSPNDPTFFLVHCWVDSLWETFRQTKQTRQERETQYVSNTEACMSYSFLNARMQPFTISNRAGLSNQYTDEFYEYEPRPTCSVQEPSCADSPYLYCDVLNSRCVSKIRAYGNCRGFEGEDICYEGQCFRGICRPVSAIFPREADNATEIFAADPQSELQNTTRILSPSTTESTTISAVPFAPVELQNTTLAPSSSTGSPAVSATPFDALGSTSAAVSSALEVTTIELQNTTPVLSTSTGSTAIAATPFDAPDSTSAAMSSTSEVTTSRWGSTTPILLPWTMERTTTFVTTFHARNFTSAAVTGTTELPSTMESTTISATSFAAPDSTFAAVSGTPEHTTVEWKNTIPTVLPSTMESTTVSAASFEGQDSTSAAVSSTLEVTTVNWQDTTSTLLPSTMESATMSATPFYAQNFTSARITSTPERTTSAQVAAEATPPIAGNFCNNY